MFEAQLDYIYFFFGLVLFLLGSVCVSMSRSGPWIRFHILAHDTGLGRSLVKAGAASPADGSGR
jgi:hypothetical protein